MPARNKSWRGLFHANVLCGVAVLAGVGTLGNVSLRGGRISLRPIIKNHLIESAEHHVFQLLHPANDLCDRPLGGHYARRRNLALVSADCAVPAHHASRCAGFY